MNSEFFTGNRRCLSEIAGGKLIVITANGLLQRNGDSPFPFRQDSSFYYLTGINEPDILLVIDEASEYLIVPGRDSRRTSFDGRIDASNLAKIGGISEALDEKVGWERLKSSAKKSKSLATLLAPPSYEKHYGMFTNPARARLIRKLKRQIPGLQITDLRKSIAEMRMIKQPVEIAAIQRAIDITASGIERVQKNLASYKYEYEIEASLSASFRSAGASGHSFSPIVASGSNACTLHNVANHSRLNPGQLVTMDVGAEIDNYAADITRTFALSKPSSRQSQVYDAVLEVQNYALSLLKPGTNFPDYENSVTRFLGGKLVELKLIDSASDTLAIRKYCPHATSHFLGLDVHDVGDYRAPLVENVVMTCEPGIYIPEEKIGVRIEDDVLITKNGNEVLSRGLPCEL